MLHLLLAITIPVQVYEMVQISHPYACWAAPLSSVHLLTAGHCVERGKSTIWHYRAGLFIGSAQVQWINVKKDIALLRVDSPGPWTSLKISKDEPQALADLFYRTYLIKGQPIVVTGRFLGIDADDEMNIDGFIMPGGSGSGVLNERGELVGVVTAVFNGGGFLRAEEANNDVEASLIILGRKVKFRSLVVATPVIGGWPKEK
jgi:S1-C subfamily serine protease